MSARDAMLTRDTPIEVWRAELERRDGAASWALGTRLVHRHERGTIGIVIANDSTHVTIAARDPECGAYDAVLMHWVAGREWRVA